MKKLNIGLFLFFILIIKQNVFAQDYNILHSDGVKYQISLVEYETHMRKKYGLENQITPYLYMGMEKTFFDKRPPNSDGYLTNFTFGFDTDTKELKSITKIGSIVNHTNLLDASLLLKQELFKDVENVSEIMGVPARVVANLNFTHSYPNSNILLYQWVRGNLTSYIYYCENENNIKTYVIVFEKLIK